MTSMGFQDTLTSISRSATSNVTTSSCQDDDPPCVFSNENNPAATSAPTYDGDDYVNYTGPETDQTLKYVLIGCAAVIVFALLLFVYYYRKKRRMKNNWWVEEDKDLAKLPTKQVHQNGQAEEEAVVVEQQEGVDGVLVVEQQEAAATASRHSSSVSTRKGRGLSMMSADHSADTTPTRNIPMSSGIDNGDFP